MTTHLTQNIAVTMIRSSDARGYSPHKARSSNLGRVFFLDAFDTATTFCQSVRRDYPVRERPTNSLAPAHTIYQRPILMRDRSKLERQSRATRATPHAVLFTHGIGQPGGPDIVRRAEAPSWATLPCLPSGRATTASYLKQSGLRPIPVDPVGMAERLSVVTVDRVG